MVGRKRAFFFIMHPGHVRYLGASAPRHHFVVRTSAVKCGLVSGLGLGSCFLSATCPDRCYFDNPLVINCGLNSFLCTTTGVRIVFIGLHTFVHLLQSSMNPLTSHASTDAQSYPSSYNEHLPALIRTLIRRRRQAECGCLYP